MIWPAHADTYQINATANPSRLLYGVDNNAAISVTVRDTNGSQAPDGTPVYFNTTLGEIPALAYTHLGKVTVLLSNSSSAGQAVITITVGASRQTLIVEYLGKGEVAVAYAKRVSYHLKAKQVYFGVDPKVFDLRDNAILTAPTFTVKADAIQFDINKLLVTAQGNVTIKAGKEQLTGEKIIIFVANNKGDLATLTPELAFKSFTIPKLDMKDDDGARTADYHALSPEPTKTWIVCREAVVYPHDQIQFHWPKFYLNNFDHLLMVLPLHVMDLKSADAGTFFNTQISVESDAGLDIDFPIYYAANPYHIGSLHIRRVTENSPNYHGTAGAQLGIQEEYLLGSVGDGTLSGDALTGPTRSATWQQTMNFGKTRINMNAADERYAVDTPYTSRLGMTLSQDIGQTNLFLSTNWSAFQGNENGTAELTAYLPAIKLGKTHLSLAFSPFIGESLTINTNANDQTTATPTTLATASRVERGSLPPASPLVNETTISTSLIYEGLRSGLNFPGWRIFGGNLTPSMSHQLMHNDNGVTTQTLDAGASFIRKLNKYCSSTMSYSYSVTDSTQSTATTAPEQRVSLNLSATKEQNLFQLYSSYSISEKSLFGSANTRYYLPWGKSRHKLRRLYLQYAVSLTSTNTALAQMTTIDHLLSLGWDLGAYNIVLQYSPSGTTVMTGFGSGTGKHWAIAINRQSW